MTIANYINRDDLIWSLKEQHDDIMMNPDIGSPMKWREAICFHRILEVLQEAPTLDVVEVIRCKDCKHYKPRNYQSSRWSSKKPCCTRSACISVNENDFCSFGERKEGANE